MSNLFHSLFPCRLRGATASLLLLLGAALASADTPPTANVPATTHTLAPAPRTLADDWADEAAANTSADVVAAEKTVSALSRLNRDVVVLGKVDGPVNLVGGDLYVLGRVNGPVSVINGRATILGNVRGAVSIVGGDLRVAGVIKGSTSVVGGSLVRAPGARIDGNTSSIGSPGFNYINKQFWFGTSANKDPSPLYANWLWWSVGIGLVLLVCWLATSSMMTLLFPEMVNRAADLLSRETLKVFAAGLMFWFVFGIATLVAVFLSGFLIGVPLLGGLLLLGVAVRWIGLAAVFLWIGRAVLGRMRRVETPGPWAALCTGAIVVALAHMIPLVGIVLWFLFLIPVAGAVVLAFAERNRRVTTIRPPLQPVAPGQDSPQP